MNQILPLPGDCAYVNWIRDRLIFAGGRWRCLIQQHRVQCNFYLGSSPVLSCSGWVAGHSQEWVGHSLLSPCLGRRGFSCESNSAEENAQKLSPLDCIMGHFFLGHWHFMAPSFIFKHHNTQWASGVHGCTATPRLGPPPPSSASFSLLCSCANHWDSHWISIVFMTEFLWFTLPDAKECIPG